MEEKMDELIEAINSVSGNSCIDYLLIFLPMVLSVIAIIISISTAQKQNRIALLEKRTQTISLIKRILVFSGQMSNVTPETKDGIKSICTLFNAHFDEKSLLDDRMNPSVSVTRLVFVLDSVESDLEMTEFLFGKDVDSSKNRIIKKMREMMVDLSIIEAGHAERFWKRKKEFCNLCDDFEQQYMPQLRGQTKI